MREAGMSSDTARWWATEGGTSEWWRTASSGEVTVPEEKRTPPEASDSAVAFWGVLAFTFVLLIAPQASVPALQVLRLAFVSVVVSVVALFVYRWSHGRPLCVMTRELWIAAALLTWATVTVPWSYWPGGSVSFLLQVYVKSL